MDDQRRAVVTAVKGEFIGGPRDGQEFWCNGEPFWEMPDRDSERTIVYRAGGILPRSGNVAYLWDGYREGGVKEVKLHG